MNRHQESPSLVGFTSWVLSSALTRSERASFSLNTAGSSITRVREKREAESPKNRRPVSPTGEVQGGDAYTAEASSLFART